jgi:hypothetical protein
MGRTEVKGKISGIWGGGCEKLGVYDWVMKEICYIGSLPVLPDILQIKFTRLSETDSPARCCTKVCTNLVNKMEQIYIKILILENICYYAE